MRRGTIPAIAAVAALACAAPIAGQTYAGGGGTQPALAGFGGALAITQGDLLVGEGRNQARSGLVYVYRKGAGGWAEAAKIAAPSATNGDGFGSALALDGATLVVGATLQNEQKGAAYVFRREANGAYTHVAQLVATDGAAGDNFGASVAVDGDYALVGAPAHGSGAGAVYVFQRAGNAWTQQAKLVPSGGAAGEGFGVAVAIEGSRALIGAPGRNDRAGVVLVFTRSSTGQWTQSGQISPNGLQRNDQFGSSIALVEGTAYVSAPSYAQGAGAVWALRQNDDSEWRPTGRFFPFAASGQASRFGAAIDVEGSQLFVGAPAGPGAVFVYAAGQDGEWNAAERMTAPDAGGGIGGAVAVDGDVAAAWAQSADYGAGNVVVFERTNGRWAQAAVLSSPDDRIASITGNEIRCGADGTAGGFDCQNVELVSFLNVSDLGGARGVRMNDVWGWVDAQNNREYVIAGRMDGTSFVDITDPENPRYLGNLPMTPGARAAAWRDMKVYKDHVFIVSDGAGEHGMQVFDLGRLRNLREPQIFEPDFLYRNINSAHNIVINEETGFAYIVGASGGGETCGGGLHMVNIQDPKNPTFAGCFADPQTGRAATGYSHDAQCVVYNGPDRDYAGREICLGANETALSIADVTDKNNPKAIARASYPNVGYSHQGWFDEEQRYFYMDDELDELQGLVPRTRTIIWDLSDLDDP